MRWQPTVLRLDRFYSAHVNCSPTRTSILTGRHPIRSGVFGPNWSTRPEEITIAQLLQRTGYRTGHFGKWHVGAVKAASPTNPKKLGFDEYLSHDNFFELHPMLSRNGEAPTVHQGESSQVVVDAEIEFIRGCHQSQQPFFTLVWFGSPHSPYSGLPADTAQYAAIENEALRNRLTEISAMDRAIGGLRQALRDLKIHENTLVWFCSDNGLGHDPKMSFNGPWRDKKGSIYEGGVRVPGIIEWPKVIPTARTSILPCVTTDMMPTILDLLDLSSMLPSRPMDGISIKKWIVGEESASRPRPIGFWKYASAGEQQNERWMPKELTQGTTPTVNNPSIDFVNYRHPMERKELDGDAAWTDNQYKLVVRGKEPKRKPELYDLLDDPGEKNDISDKYPDRCAQMLKDLIAWQRSVERSLTGADYR